ncbi:hypothetical protein, partial [Streptomyces sp. NPDC058394]|uniref:hypothetical protein n=1 Tax=Streptomyces sp. NPDC058394 TaxID=3346477 RepID=UPI00364706F6
MTAPARRLGKLVKDNGWDEAQQLSWWQAEQDQRRTQTAARKAARKAAGHVPVPHVGGEPTKLDGAQAGVPDASVPKDEHVARTADQLPSPRLHTETPGPAHGESPTSGDGTSLDQETGVEADSLALTPAELAPGQSGWIDSRQKVTRMPWHDGRQ